jgi:hypothetical protein
VRETSGATAGMIRSIHPGLIDHPSNPAAKSNSLMVAIVVGPL